MCDRGPPPFLGPRPFVGPRPYLSVNDAYASLPMRQHQMNLPRPNSDFCPPLQRPQFPGRLPPHYSGLRLPPPSQILASQHHRLSAPRFSAAHFRPSPQEQAGGSYNPWQPASILPPILHEGELRLQLQSEMYQMLPPMVGTSTMQAPMQQQGTLTMPGHLPAQRLPDSTGTCNEFFHYPQENSSQFSFVLESTPGGLPLNAQSNEYIPSAANPTKSKSSNRIVEELLFKSGEDCRKASKSHAKESDKSKSDPNKTSRSNHSQDDKSSQKKSNVSQIGDSTTKSREESSSRKDSHSEEICSQGKSKSPCKWPSKSTSRREDKSPSRGERDSSVRRHAGSLTRQGGTSSARRASRSPARRKRNFSARREDKAPTRKNSKSPTRQSNSSARREDKSSARKNSKSPTRQSNSLAGREDKSPARKNSKSPTRQSNLSARREDKSSVRKNSKSPIRQSNSSAGREDKSPARKNSKSPTRQTNSSARREDKSSARRNSKSPTRQSNSSARREDKSSASKNSKSPTRQSNSSVRLDDKSPARRKSKSPSRQNNSLAGRKNESPTRQGSQSPSKRKGYSPNKREGRSPARRQSKSPARREDNSKLESRSSTKSCDDGTPRKRGRSQLDKSTDYSDSKRRRLGPSQYNVTRHTTDRSSSSCSRYENSQRLPLGHTAVAPRSRPSSSGIGRAVPERLTRPVRNTRECPRRPGQFFRDAIVSPRRHDKPVNNGRGRAGRRYEPKHDRKHNPWKLEDAKDSPGRRGKAALGAGDNPAKPVHDSDRMNEKASTEIPMPSNMSGSYDITASQEQGKTSVLGEDEEEMIEEEYIPDWIRCSPADLYFKRDKQTNVLTCTKRMLDLEKKFENELLKRAEKVRMSKPAVVLPPRKSFETPSQPCAGSSGGNGSDHESEGEDGEEQTWLDELNWRKMHPERLHEELWFNLPHEMNDGPLCRCSSHDLGYGIRHNIYPGEKVSAKCDPATNNPDNLYHYRITMSPHTNFLNKSPTVIEFDSHEYIFEGFSLFSHYKIDKVPLCKVIRFNIEYTIHYFEEDMVENFDVKSLDVFADYLYREILELYDLDWAGRDYEETCRRFHIMPRFSRNLPENGKEILSMNEVMNYLLKSSKMLCDQANLATVLALPDCDWQKFVDDVRGMIVTYPGMRPCSVRIDQLDREQRDPGIITFPKIVHFGVRPAQLSYAGDSTYQKLWKQYIRLKHLVANKPKVTLNDREKLRKLEEALQDIRLKGTMKRETTVEISSEGFIRTGIKSDICQHALLLPVLIQHLLFHKCLDVLEELISYKFKDRLLLQLALTHPSFRMNYGTNADHARNSLTNCGKRQLEYGDKRIHFIHTRKRGINTLMYIMSKMANSQETASEIHHYERLEFLGDAVIEFLSSIHLFFLFPRLEEGGLATYRAALVQNQHLSVLSEKMGLQHFMLYAHGPDLCHDINIRHALANCFEALMGALFLDGGIGVADIVFGEALFKNEDQLLYIWKHLPLHPLQDDEPNGDRHWIDQSIPLQKLVSFEESTGIVFNHIRLLARAFTMRNIGFNNLTLGHNQTLEFLGDTVLQLISSDYLFRHFPDHHEGHLTLLRSSLVNNRTQAIICDDLGMTEYVINNDLNVKERISNEQNKVKDKADIVEAFIGALYVDQGIEACTVFCQVCFYPRLKEFIMNQDWNDAKSQLQQCCLTLRDTAAGEPDIPVYKVLQSIGPTNTRKYHVAVYFRGERLATGVGHSIQQAEMNTAAKALRDKADLFPHLLHTKRFLDWRFSQMKDGNDEDRASNQFLPTPSTSTGPVRHTKTAKFPRRQVRRATAKRSEVPSLFVTTEKSQLTVPPTRKRIPAVTYNATNRFRKKRSASRVT